MFQIDDKLRNIEYPFGEADCEAEIKQLEKEGYGSYFFYKTEFNPEALENSTYLIVGRRGSGKTALSHYFSFQRKFRRAIAIDVNEPALFQKVLTEISYTIGWSREVAIPRIEKVWEIVIWSVIFRELRDRDKKIKKACIFGHTSGKVSQFVLSVLRNILKLISKSDNELTDQLEDLVADPIINLGKEAVLSISRREAIFIAFDTLENYTTTDDATMWAMAGLIQCASNFNRDYAHRGIHLKLFMMSEIYPYLKERTVLNTLKFTRNELYLNWYPRDLLRLICWRFFVYLKVNKYINGEFHFVDWSNYSDVKEKIWDKYFGKTLHNGRSLEEETFPYVLRHTQLRPRQIILICNQIAKYAKKERTFPFFSNSAIIKGVRKAEKELANEILNSYSSLYPMAGDIINSLNRSTVLMTVKDLYQKGKDTSSYWKDQYSQENFCRMLIELGIVGRVRHSQSHFIEADFEYSSSRQIVVKPDDECVIHPMFFDRLETIFNKEVVVFPFPDRKNKDFWNDF